MITSKLEVLVDLGPTPEQKLVDHTINELKSHDGIKEAVFRDGAFMVETTLPNRLVLDIVEKSCGKRTVLQGFGEGQSAVAMITDCGPNVTLGVIRFQETVGGLVGDGSVDGLAPGMHGLHVRDDGDISLGCASLGPHYNPHGSPHGAPADPPGARHAGDLGNIVADERGRATFRIVDNVLKLSDIIGRAIAITEKPDDLGRGTTTNSKVDGDSGPAIACGIIARSAGIFQNPKRICQCDGVVVWDERDKPLAGAGRRQKNCCGNHGNKENSGNIENNGKVENNGNIGNKPKEDARCCKI